MKRCGFFTLALILLCASSLDIDAQKKGISKEEYNRALQFADGRTKNFSYRIKGESRVLPKDEKETSGFRKWIYEFQPPHGNRWVSETKKAGQDKVEIIETIEAGNFRYTRTDKGEWKAQRMRGGYNNLPLGSIYQFEKEEFYLTENVKYKNQKVNLYEYTAKTKIFRFQLQLKGIPPPKPVEARHTEKRWITPEGLLMKIEIISDSQLLNLNNDLIYNVSTYEYDPKIKIKAPIPEPQEKFTTY